MFNAKHSISVNSCTSALLAACAAIGLNPGDEVIVTPFSMSCSATIPLHFGAIPVFADIEEDYFCLNPRSIEEKITKRTKAIIVVDLFGQPYDVGTIKKIAIENGLYIIEDAAQSLGAHAGGYGYAGTFGDIGCFSFTQGKHISAGEGGMIITNNDLLAQRCAMFRNHAEAVNNDLNDERFDDLAGLNLRMTELQAMMVLNQLPLIPYRMDDIFGEVLIAGSYEYFCALYLEGPIRLADGL